MLNAKSVLRYTHLQAWTHSVIHSHTCSLRCEALQILGGIFEAAMSMDHDANAEEMNWHYKMHEASAAASE